MPFVNPPPANLSGPAQILPKPGHPQDGMPLLRYKTVSVQGCLILDLSPLSSTASHGGTSSYGWALAKAQPRTNRRGRVSLTGGSACQELTHMYITNVDGPVVVGDVRHLDTGYTNWYPWP